MPRFSSTSFRIDADEFIRCHDQRRDDRLFDLGDELRFGKCVGLSISMTAPSVFVMR